MSEHRMHEWRGEGYYETRPREIKEREPWTRKDTLKLALLVAVIGLLFAMG